MTNEQTLQRADRYSYEALRDMTRKGSQRERDLAAVILANREVRAGDAEILEDRDAEIARFVLQTEDLTNKLENAVLDRMVGNPVLKVAPAHGFAPQSIRTSEEMVHVAVEFLIDVHDIGPAFAAFADGALWLCGIGGGTVAEKGATHVKST